MTADTKKKKSDSKLDGSQYSCQVILEKCTLEQAHDRSLPTDARLIRYSIDGKDYLDVTRSAKASTYLIYTMIPMVRVLFNQLIMVKVQCHRVSGVINHHPKQKSENNSKIWRKNIRAIF